MSETNSLSFTYPPTTTPQVPTGVYASPTLGKLFEALAKAQGEFDVAIFDAENPHFRNRFATLKAVDAATKKQLVKHGLAVTQLPYTGSDGAPHMLTVLGHTSGEFIGGDLRLILQKQDMQGLGSAVTYGKRYAKSAILGVVSDEDDDGNAAVQKEERHYEEPEYKNGEKPATKAQVDMLKKKAKARGMSDDDLMALTRSICGSTKLEDLSGWMGVTEAVKKIDGWKKN